MTLAKAKYIKVKDISPGTGGHNLVVKVVSVETVFDKPRTDGQHTRIAEVLVGDETGCIVFKARNDQIEKLEVGSTVVIRNASVEMYKSSFMRLVVTIWGKISSHPDGVASTPAAPQSVNEQNNLSKVEYVLVDAGDGNADAE